MADFEDNNPFAGSDTKSEVSDNEQYTSVSTSLNDENNNPNDDLDDFEGVEQEETGEQGDEDRKDTLLSPDDSKQYHLVSRAYNSRVEQLLEENPNVQISIVDAGKSHEGNSRGFIAYTIKIQDLSVRRRYSEFESLRTTLTKLFPTLIVPPIPEKHSMSDYAASPTKAKEDSSIIEHRHRMLAVFLNRCLQMKQIRNNSVFQRFLDPNSSWSEVLNSPPVSNLPKSILKAPPLDPSAPTPAHAYLPIPSSSAKLGTGGGGNITGRRLSEDLGNAISSIGSATTSAINSVTGGSAGTDATDTDTTESANTATAAADATDTQTLTFDNVEQNAKEYEAVIVGGLEKVNRRIIKRYSDIASDYAELGAKFNAFSLEESGPLARAVEKVGQAVDDSYMAMETLVNSLSSSFSEPLGESAQFAAVVRSVLKYRRQKSLQLELTAESLKAKKTNLSTLERSEQEAQRINNYLQGDNDTFPPTHNAQASTSPTKAKKSSGFKFPGLNNINQAIHGIIDVDPETTRRNNIGKTREQINQLEDALVVAKSDVVDANQSVREDLERFQRTKEDDLRKIMNAYIQCHIEWAKKNLEGWQECRQEVDKL